jgi:hypothetical protein
MPVPAQAQLQSGMHAAAVQIARGAPDPLDRPPADAVVLGILLLARGGDRLQIVGHVNAPQRIRHQR